MTNNKPLNHIRSVIIDDEQANRDLIGSMLLRHCSNIEIVGTASSAAEGFELISRTSPDLVFLDVQMPESTGFDMLRKFSEIGFHVIFVSAYDKYAIDAFEFNALDYILKPLDYTRIIKAIAKAEIKIKDRNYSEIIHFIHSMDEKDNLQKRISLHHNDKVHMVDVNNVCYIQAMRGYCEIVLIDNQKFVSSKTLSEYETLLSRFNYFLRVNKSMIININHIKDYTKGMDCVITIGDNAEVEVSRRKKTSIIQYLKGIV